MKREIKYNSVKEFFEKNLKHVKFDKNLYNKLKHFRVTWSNKSEEYIDFLGSNLLGSHEIRFSSQDDETVMNIFNVTDLKSFQEEFYKVKTINPEFKVSSNVIYNTLLYAAHKFITSKVLNKDLKVKATTEACLIILYKMFTSIYSNWFIYLVSKDVANTTYERLSYKFIIKRLKTWDKLFRYRASECTDPKWREKSRKGLTNYQRLVRFTAYVNDRGEWEDDAVMILNDIQTKLRSIVKTYYNELKIVLEKGEIIGRESDTFVGGEKDEKQVNSREYGIYNKLHSLKLILYNKSDMVSTPILKVVGDLFPKLDTGLLKQFIICMADEKFNPPKKFIPLVEKIIEIDYNYLSRIGVNMLDKQQIIKTIVLIKNYWSSSSPDDPYIPKIKEYLKKKAKECTGRKTNPLATSLSLAYIVYLTIKALED